MAIPRRKGADNWVRVFISHKEEDKELAFATRQVLEAGCNNLRCYVSGAGYAHDWLATIKSELACTDVLLLLYTSPAKQWDWPLYEVGLFTPLEDRRTPRPIIYLYAGEHRPAPLEHLQGVRVDPANLGAVEKFLNEFYKTSEITGREPALLPRISRKEIESRAVRLSQAFLTAAAVRIYPTYRLELTGAPGGGGINTESNSIPRECCIEQCTPPTLSVFGFAECPKTWGQALDSITEDSEWKDELNVQYRNAIGGRVAFPTASTFRGLQDSRNFRAMITLVERADTRVIRVAIAFVPEQTPAIVGGPTFNILRVATRFETEVVQRFAGQLRECVERNGEERAFSSLLGAILNIERESNELRFLDPLTVCSVFSESTGDREAVARMLKEWRPLRERIFACAESRDVGEMEALLEDLRCKNIKFLRMISRRHWEIIEKEMASVLDNVP